MRILAAIALIASLGLSALGAAHAEYTCPRGSDMVNGKCVQR